MVEIKPIGAWNKKYFLFLKVHKENKPNKLENKQILLHNAL